MFKYERKKEQREWRLLSDILFITINYLSLRFMFLYRYNFVEDKLLRLKFSLLRLAEMKKKSNSIAP